MNPKLGFKESERILIINADDFGITQGTNEAILALFQQAAITSRGIEPTHLDSHAGSIMGICTGRDFLEIALDLCQEYQLPFNLPRRTLMQPFFNKEQKERFSKRISSAERRGILLIDDMISLPYCFNTHVEYETVKAQFMTMIENLKPGITQLTVHPAIITEELKRLTNCYFEREMEFRLLCDLDIMQLFNKENIKLISWKDIRDKQRSTNGKR